MAILPQFDELFKPYSANGASLEGLHNWMVKQSTNITPEVADQVIAEVMLEIAGGKEFSKTGCDCGCGMTNIHSQLAHYMLTKALALSVEVQAARIKALNERVNAAILSHVELQKKEVVKGVVEESKVEKPTSRFKKWLKHG